MALQPQTVHVPLMKGVNTKADPRALETPDLMRCENAVFDKVGGIQKRNGFDDLGVLRMSDDTAISRLRAVTTVGDELLMLAGGKAWSRSDKNSRWMDKGRFDAVSVEQQTVAFRQKKVQESPDRAELKGVILYAWQQSDGVAYQLVDKATGAVFQTALTPLISNAKIPKCRAVDDGNNTRLHLYYLDSSGSPGPGRNLKVRVIDPDDVYGTATSAALTVASGDVSVQDMYDVARKGTLTTLIAYRTTGNVYAVYEVNALGTIVTNRTVSRSVSGGLALDYHATANKLVVLRVADATEEIRYDYLDPTTLADVGGGVDILMAGLGAGNSHNVTVILASNGVAWAFWDYADGAYNYVQRRWGNDSGIMALSADVLVRHSYLACRGAIWNDVAESGAITERLVVMVHSIGTRILNQYVLLDADRAVSANEVGLLARLIPGEGPDGIITKGRLPQLDRVTNTSYLLVQVYRRKLQANKKEQLVAAEIGIKEWKFTTQEASAHEGVRIGKCLYTGGGYLAYYDGDRFVEQGFWRFPEGLADPTFTNGAGQLANNATHNYRFRWEYRNRKGELERSSAVVKAVTVTGTSNIRANFTIPTLPYTNKKDVVLAVFRTVSGEPADGLYYRCSSLNPSEATYKANDPNTDSITWQDSQYNDADILTHELDFESSGLIDDVPPGAPPQKLAAGQNRLFAMHPEDKNTVMYSQLRLDGDVVAFNDALEIKTPEGHGVTTSVVPGEDAVVLFKERAAYICAGTGTNNNGVGSYGEPQLIAAQAGCTEPRSVAQIPSGTVFWGEKGPHFMDRGYQVEFIPAPEAYRTRTITGAIPIPDKHQVRFLCSSGGSLLWDYLTGQWSDWPEVTGESTTYCNGKHVYLRNSDTVVRVENDASWLDAGVDYSLVVETAWMKLAGLLGYKRARKWGVLGEYRTLHDLRLQVAYRYVDTWVDTRGWTPVDKGGNTLTAGQPEMVITRFSRQKVPAFRVRIQDVRNGVTLLGESIRLTGLSVEVGINQGLVRANANQQV